MNKTDAVFTDVRGYPTWSEYFSSIAEAVATRATCPRKSVGAVIVRDHRIIATGYNGSPSGWDQCNEVGCHMVDGHCKRAIHAEKNALLYAARHGIALRGATCYVTVRPCLDCFQSLAVAGVNDMRYVESYGNDDAYLAELAAKYGVTLAKVQSCR